MNPTKSMYIVAFKTNKGVNPTIRLGTIETIVDGLQKHAHKLSGVCYLFTDLAKANEAIRAVSGNLITTDEILIFSVEKCYGAFSAETQKIFDACQLESIHIPLLNAGKERPSDGQHREPDRRK